MKTFLPIVAALVLCAAMPLQAQQQHNNTFIIKGTVVDSLNNETVPYATISAFKANMPLKPVKRQAADANGKFELTISGADSLGITIEAVGMKSRYVPVTDFSKPTIDLGNVWISANDKMLTEVTVTAAKPLVQVDLDKISYDMKADPEAETNTTLDMLRKVPMVTVDGDENIKVKGQSNFRIFMNGKETAMFTNNPSQVLKSIPASTVKRIEVITEPGAKYQAEGLAGIINIVTESAMAGYTTTLQTAVDNYGSLRGGGYFSTKIGKWGITANLNMQHFKNPGMSMNTERESFNNPTHKHLTSTHAGNSRGVVQFSNLNLSYEIDSLNLITLSGNGWGGKYAYNLHGSTLIRNHLRDTTLAYYSNDEQAGVFGGYEGSLDYQRSFKKPDKLLTASYKLSYAPGGTDNTSEITATKNYSDRKQHIISNSSGSEHTFQLDYTEPFNKKHVVEAGIKYIYRLNRSDNEYRLWDAGAAAWTPDPIIPANGIVHANNIMGLYGSYTYKLQKFSARIGGRLEHSKITIHNRDNSKIAPKPYNNVVPSITLSYHTTPASSIKLSYTQRISRPDISYLNPFVNNSNPNFITQGNPHLNPEISNSFSLNYNLFTPKINFNGSLYTSFANNSIESINTLRGDTVFETYENIGKKRVTGISTYIRWQITQALSIYMNGNGSYSQYIYNNNGKRIANQGLAFSVYGGGDYNLPFDFSLALYSGYASPSVMLQGQNTGYYYYGLGLNKAFLGKKLNIRLNANGFLERFVHYTNITTTDEYRNYSVFTRPSPRFGISVSYRFGEMKAQIKNISRGITNDDVKSGGGNQQGGGNQGRTQQSGG